MENIRDYALNSSLSAVSYADFTPKDLTPERVANLLLDSKKLTQEEAEQFVNRCQVVAHESNAAIGADLLPSGFSGTVF